MQRHLQMIRFLDHVFNFSLFTFRVARYSRQSLCSHRRAVVRREGHQAFATSPRITPTSRLSSTSPSHLPRIALRDRRRHRHRSPLSLHFARNLLQLSHARPHLSRQSIVHAVSASLVALELGQSLGDVEAQATGDGVEVFQARHARRRSRTGACPRRALTSAARRIKCRSQRG